MGSRGVMVVGVRALSRSVLSRSSSVMRETVMEPFRVKSVVPIKMTTEGERRVLLSKAHYNPFLLSSDNVLIDLLSESGTGAMSAAQWGAMMIGDESYAGAPSFDRFRNAILDAMPNFKTVFPVHQGRAIERIFAAIFYRPGVIVPANTHFDTTRANFEHAGAHCVDLPTPQAKDTNSDFPFKGNMDIDALRSLLQSQTDDIPLILVAVTNNARGGHPVSMENLHAVSKLAREFGKPLLLDSCRFAENAYLIKIREKGYAHKSIREIVKEMFSLVNVTYCSAKKDAMANIGLGGFVCFDSTMGELESKVRDLLILGEGFTTYGGLAGRDLDAIAVGLVEGMEEEYLAYRIGTMEYVVSQLSALSIPVLRPAGGHAVFVDAGRMLPHIPALQYPGHSLVCALYLSGGIRGVEIGSLMFGQQPDGSEKPAPQELTRLAFPRRVYTSAHLDFIIETFAALSANADSLPGYRIIQSPASLRHFSARLLPIDPESSGIV